VSQPLRHENLWDDGDAEAGAEPCSEPAPKVAARGEHRLQSLLELTRELTVSLDLYEIADLLLFNVMGQVGTTRAALWLLSESGASRPVMIRCHGFNRQAVDPLIAVSATVLLERLVRERSPVPSWALWERRELSEFALLRQLDVALFAPVFAHGEILGLLALGSKVDAAPFSPEDLQTVDAALGVAGMWLQNTRLYNRMLENNRQLRLTNERLLELDRLKSQFISNVNHELRTPLAVVMATLECLVEQRSLEPGARELVGGALGKSRDLKGLIENLLTLSDAASGRLPIRIETHDVAAVLRAFYAERVPGVTETLRQFSCQLSPGLPPARCDRQLLLQILNELVDNALKFTPRGSHLLLRAECMEEADRMGLEVELSDDGPGIPSDRIDSLFRSFEQVDGSSTRNVGGLGIGLTFARQLAKRMDAELTVRSTLGQGAAFTLLLPLA